MHKKNDEMFYIYYYIISLRLLLIFIISIIFNFIIMVDIYKYAFVVTRFKSTQLWAYAVVGLRGCGPSKM